MNKLLGELLKSGLDWLMNFLRWKRADQKVDAIKPEDFDNAKTEEEKRELARRLTDVAND